MTDEIIDLARSRGVVTAEVVARILGVHPRKIQRLSASGELPFQYMQIGREYRYPLAQVNRYLADHGMAPYSDDDVAALEAKIVADRHAS